MIATTGDAQNVGIGTTTPSFPLQVTSANTYGLYIENTTPFNTGTTSSLLFGSSPNTPSVYKYMAAIRATATSGSSARLGLFTYAGSTTAGLKERMTITDDGLVGINTLLPQSQLHVASYDDNIVVENPNSLDNFTNSSIYFGANVASQNPYRYTGAIRSIGTSTSTARLGFFTYASYTKSGLAERITIADNGAVGINNPNPSYRLDVTGSIRATDNLAISDDASIGNNLAVANEITVKNGKGIVSSTTSDQLKVYLADAWYGVTIGPFGFGDFTYNFQPGIFSTPPKVFVGDATSTTGEWHKLRVEIKGTTTTSCIIRFYNDSPNAVTADAVWSLLCIGS